MFDFTKDDLFYCINDKMDKIQNALSQKKNENMCDHDCFKSNKKIVNHLCNIFVIIIL